MVSAVQFRPWPPASAPRSRRRLSAVARNAKADRSPSSELRLASPAKSFFELLEHLKQRFAGCRELALAILHHRVEQLPLDRRQRGADGGYRSRPAFTVEGKFRVAVPDGLQPPLEFLLDRLAHTPSCPPRLAWGSTDIYVV